MFNLEEFIIVNLIEGYRSDTFNEYQVNIYASGYMLKGAITQEGFNEILQAIENIKNPPEYEELLRTVTMAFTEYVFAQGASDDS